MDLQFLTTEQLDLTLKLADILSMEDLTSVAAILASFNWNLENAIAWMQIGPMSTNSTNAAPYKNEQAAQNAVPIDPNPYSYEGEGQEYNQYEEDNEYEYSGKYLDQKKKMFEQEYASLLPLQKTLSEPNKELNILQYHKLLANDSRAHRVDYMRTLMSKSESICNNILLSKGQGRNTYKQSQLKIENNRKFINFLYTNYHPRINFTFGTFFLNLTRSYLEGKFLLVYIHNITIEGQTKFKKLIELIFRQKQIANFVNENCISYGLFDNSDDYENIQKYVPLKDLPAFALFKFNKNKRSEEFISAYKITSQGQIFLQWLASNIGIKLKKKEAALKDTERQVKDEISKQQLKQKKIEENNQALLKKEQQYYDHSYIREQQDQLYAQLEKTYLNKKKLSLDRKQHIQTEQQQLDIRRKEAQKDKEPQSLQNAIQIRFRMPISGESVSRRFYLNDPVSKLFTFVDCFCREEFEQRFNDFDLRQTFPPLNLRDFTEKPLRQVFQDSKRENIVVRQL